MNNKILLLILILLLAVWGGSKLFNKPVNKSFKEELVTIDSALVDKIVITPQNDPGNSIFLEKSGEKWMVKSADHTATAMDNIVQSLLSQVTEVKAKRLVAKSKDKWVQYEVNEQTGTKIELFGNGNLLSSFISGRLNFNQQQRSATSYIRLDGEEDTYAVDGFLSMAFKQGFDSFRDKRLISLNKDDVTRIILSGTQESIIGRNGEDWINQDGVVIDSVSMATYLNGIVNLNGATFNDDFNGVTSPPTYTLTIEANNQLTPVSIQSWKIDEDTFVLNSSLNPEGKFESDREGIFKKLILDFPG